MKIVVIPLIRGMNEIQFELELAQANVIALWKWIAIWSCDCGKLASILKVPGTSNRFLSLLFLFPLAYLNKRGGGTHGKQML